MQRALQYLSLFFLLSCPLWSQAKAGFIDFSQEGTFLDDAYPLNGEWEFYWNQLLSPVDFHTKISSDCDSKLLEVNCGLPGPAPEFVTVPGSWSGSLQQKKYPGTGFGTYRLKIHLPVDPDLNDIIFKFSNVRTAYRVWVNGQTLLTSGTVATSAEKSRPRLEHHQVPYHVTKRNLEVIIQVSNYETRAGGILEEISIARADRSLTAYRNSVAFEMFLAGCLFIMGFYHLGLHLVHRETRGTLYFGLLCLVVMMRTLLNGNILIVSFVPDISYFLQVKMEYASISLSAMLFILYVKAILRNEIRSTIMQTYATIFAIACGLQLFLPVKIVSFLNLPIMAFVLPPGIYITFVASQSLRTRSVHGRVFFFGWLLLFMTAINDILIGNEVIHGPLLLPVGIIGFTFSQAILLAIRFANAFSSVEELSLQLSHSNSELKNFHRTLEDKIRDRTLELNRSLREMKTDISMARRIQSSLFSIPRLRVPGAEILCRYIPMLEVGGDFYDIYEMPDGRIRLLVADATGHGVRGAMITIAIKAEYEPLKRIFDTPKMALQSLNRNYIEKYGSLGSYLSAIIADFDPNEKTLTFAVAGHPPPIRVSIDGEIEIPSVSGSLIGLNSEAEFENHDLPLQERDRIFLYSDGLFDQFSPQKELIVEEDLLNVLRSHCDVPLGQTLDAILDFQNQHLQSSPRSDDMTILVLELWTTNS